MTPGRTPGPRGPRGVLFGVGGVAVLLGLAVVLGMNRQQNVAPLASADTMLARLGPVAPRPAVDTAGVPSAIAAARVQADVDRAWRASLEPAGYEWHDQVQPLPAESLRILTALDVPRPVALAYGVSFAAAGELQSSLGIRDVVSGHARSAAAADRDGMARDLRRQATCLAGVYLGSRFGPRELTPTVVGRLLDAGLVRGTRDPGLDAWLVRGSRSRHPAVCRVFSSR